MSRRPWNIFFFITIFIVFCLYLNLPFDIDHKFNFANRSINFFLKKPEINLKLGDFNFQRDLNFRQGLDLRGGMQVILKANMDQIPEEQRITALESAHNVISRRVDLYGVAEAAVKTSVSENDYRLIVELPGIDKPQEALNLIGQTASLVFGTPVFDDLEATSSGSTTPINFNPSDLTGADLESATLTYETQNSQPAVALKFKESGRDKFATLTSTYLNKPLAIILDGIPLTAPTIQSVITDGQAIISGNFTIEEAKLLATQLNAGALPVPIEVLSQKNISATLGEDSIRQSLIAGGVGLLVVVLFMISYYGWLGVVAVIGLAIYTLVSATLYRLIPITLTLPGIAGFILSVGMAVDSNILVFERFREEKRKGSPTNISLELAFGRAWDSIKDANIATIITGLILFNPLDWNFLNSSGAVRGFALTLLLGIIVSLFTGIVVTRTLLRLFAPPPKLIVKSKSHS